MSIGRTLNQCEMYNDGHCYTSSIDRQTGRLPTMVPVSGRTLKHCRLNEGSTPSIPQDNGDARSIDIKRPEV